MMIKITERCTMGCIHCLNSASPDGKDMSVETLTDVLNFLFTNDLGKMIIITGGEPLEHENFAKMMKCIYHWNIYHDNYIRLITITTNGEKILEDQDQYKSIVDLFKQKDVKLIYQISADTRYYPRRIPIHKRIFREPSFVLVDNCIDQIYPQGRAVDNHLPWFAKAMKCFNVRSITKSSDCTLSNIEYILAEHAKFCTPHIKIDGSIGLGESDLCPPCGTIYDSQDEIIDKIRNFKCDGCSHIYKMIPNEYKEILGLEME